MSRGRVSELSQIISKHIELDHALVIYREPEERFFSLMAGPWNTSDVLENSGKDQFVLSPFMSQRRPRFIITPDLQIGMDSIDIDFDFRHMIPHDEKADNDRNFISMVGNGISKIKKGDFDKVVLSRPSEIQLDKDFNPIAFLGRLTSAYPECFCFFILIPGQTCWLGASPELLAKREKSGAFKTVSLAGTLPSDYQEKGLEWSEKEIEEQAYVSKYILDILNKHGLKHIVQIGPNPFTTGSLSHLKTTFENHSPISEKQFEAIIHDLHPTPAVCGVPKDKALNFIENFEGYDRSYYSGFIGKIAQNGEASLFVNLRSMQLFKNKAILYAGAGITADSTPEKELEETERKMDALRRFIHA